MSFHRKAFHKSTMRYSNSNTLKHVFLARNIEIPSKNNHYDMEILSAYLQTAASCRFPYLHVWSLRTTYVLSWLNFHNIKEQRRGRVKKKTLTRTPDKISLHSQIYVWLLFFNIVKYIFSSWFFVRFAYFCVPRKIYVEYFL